MFRPAMTNLRAPIHSCDYLPLAPPRTASGSFLNEKLYWQQKIFWDYDPGTRSVIEKREMNFEEEERTTSLAINVVLPNYNHQEKPTRVRRPRRGGYQKGRSSE